MEKDEEYNEYIIKLSETEFNYICELLEEVYKSLNKLPKKFRTIKFYTLENLVKNVFNK